VDGVHGRVVPPAAPEELAAAVLDLARDPQARVRMSAASQQLGRRFDIRTAVAHIEQAYLELATLHRGLALVHHVA
jgi:glycosyltransferase involved in cell wall biosynthesis